MLDELDELFVWVVASCWTCSASSSPWWSFFSARKGPVAATSAAMVNADSNDDVFFGSSLIVEGVNAGGVRMQGAPLRNRAVDS